MTLPKLKPQEIPFDHPESNNMFIPAPEKPFVATSSAIDLYTEQTIVACLNILRREAEKHNGLDYLQVFLSDDHRENLWFIEDGIRGAITALLPSDY
jgi:hypothetical protein